MIAIERSLKGTRRILALGRNQLAGLRLATTLASQLFVNTQRETVETIICSNLLTSVKNLAETDVHITKCKPMRTAG